MSLHVVDHPLVAHYLTRLRDRETTPDEFREASDKIITLLLYEATHDLRSRVLKTQTPLETTDGHAIADRVVAVPILRAGLHQHQETDHENYYAGGQVPKRRSP